MSAIGQPRRRGVDLTPDDPILRRVEEAFTSTKVDGLFRRRLRSEVVNHYVAVREGHAAARPLAHRGMMGRLGRACLYASVAVAGSSAGVLAASQSALPGDVLYDVKIRIDELRLEAAPSDLRTAVAGYIVDARLNEAMVLAADGDWTRATLAVQAAGASTEHMAALLAADPDVEARIQAHLAVLAGLIDTAPVAAQAGLENALAVSGNALADAPRGNAGTGGGGNGNGNANAGNGGGGNGTGNANTGTGGGGNGNAGNGGGGNGSGASPKAAASAAPSAVPTPAATPSEGDEEDDDDTGGEGHGSDKAHPTPAAPSPRIPAHATKGD